MTDKQTQLSGVQTAALALGPGLASGLAFVLYARLGDLTGTWPTIFALHLSIATVEIPLLWYTMLRWNRREPSGTPLFPWRHRLTPRIVAVIGLPLLVFSFLMMGPGRFLVEAPIQESLFGWLPQWVVMELSPEAIGEMSRPLQLATWISSLVVLAGVGGITQELYFRGFLLPRSRFAPLTAAVYNAALFAVFHVVAPWGWPIFFAISLAWSLAVIRFRSVWIGVFAHTGMLLAGWLMFTAMVFG